jgi:DNA-binding XRE family transcriptional regulator
MGNGFAWEPIEGGKYRITPPRFWVDAVVYRTAPVLPPMTRDAPATGLQLVAWRETHGLTQARAALVLGVSVRTVSSAERAATAKLPRSFANVHWEAVRALART